MKLATEHDLREVIKVKVVYMNIHEGNQAEVKLPPAKIISTEKEYLDNEFHVDVSFDLSEFQKSPTEKIVFT